MHHPCLHGNAPRPALSAQPGADIAEICQLAALCGVPVVFALTRLSLGSIFGTNKRMSGEEASPCTAARMHGAALTAGMTAV